MSIVGVAFGIVFLTEIPMLVEVSPFLRSLIMYSYNDPAEDEADENGRAENVLGSIPFAFGFLLFGIIMAELMIATHDVVQSDSIWGFGQIAAFILLLTPIFTLARIIRDDYVLKSTKPIEERPLALLWRTIRKWIRKWKKHPDPESVELVDGTKSSGGHSYEAVAIDSPEEPSSPRSA